MSINYHVEIIPENATSAIPAPVLGKDYELDGHRQQKAAEQAFRQGVMRALDAAERGIPVVVMLTMEDTQCPEGTEGRWTVVKRADIRDCRYPKGLRYFREFDYEADGPAA